MRMPKKFLQKLVQAGTCKLAAAAACVRPGQPAHRQLLMSHSVAAARSLPVSASASPAFAAEKSMACHHHKMHMLELLQGEWNFSRTAER